MREEQLARLAAANINIVTLEGSRRHLALERDKYVLLVEIREDGVVNMGSAGLMTGRGFAALTWRGSNAMFVARGSEQEATLEQVDGVRGFERDVKAALESS